MTSYTYMGLHVKYRLLFSDFNETDFRKILEYQILWKFIQLEPSCPWGQADRQTDLTKLVVTFLSFANTSRNFYEHGRQREWPSKAKWFWNFSPVKNLGEITRKIKLLSSLRLAEWTTCLFWHWAYRDKLLFLLEWLYRIRFATSKKRGRVWWFR